MTLDKAYVRRPRAESAVTSLTKARLALELTKPAQLALLAFTAYASYLAAGGPLSPWRLALLGVVSVGSIGGTVALNMVLESDIDSIMARTSRRPIPSGRMSRAEGLATAAVLLAAGFAASALLNWYVVLASALALVLDIPVYTVLLKRRTPWSILFGGLAGVMPVIGGWAAADGSVPPAAIVLAMTVLAWIPIHIWYIVYYYEDDYRKASIPMLPVVSTPKRVGALATASLASMYALYAAYWLLTGKGFLGLVIGLPLVAFSVRQVRRFSARKTAGLAARDEAKAIFRFANPLLVVLFIFAVVGYPPLAVLAHYY